MDPFTGYLILLALGFMIRSGIQHARDDFKRTRDADLAAAETKAGKAKKSLTPAARNKLRRQHRTGWWASEIRHGFPVNRTGLHTGWLAHQAAAMHTKAQREAARTTHLDATASFAQTVKDHRKQQAAIRAEIEEAVAKSPVQQNGSRKAVKEAAGATVLPFPDRQPPVVRGPDPQRGGFCGIVGCKRGASVLVDGTWVCAECAGLVNRQRQRPEPGPYAIRDEVGPRLSSWLRPGDPLCEACGGEGGNADGTDACSVCRGCGAASPDPATMAPAPDGTICTACGRPGSADDPVLTDPAGHGLHRSHAVEAHERQRAALALHANAAHSNPTEGAPPMSGDTTFSGVKRSSTAAVGQADQDTTTIRARKDAAFALVDQMQSLDVDPAVLDAAASYADSLALAEANLGAAGEFAAAIGAGLERYHGGMEEATVSAPGKIAAREFHGE